MMRLEGEVRGRYYSLASSVFLVRYRYWDM